MKTGFACSTPVLSLPWIATHFICTLETSVNHFAYHVHKIFRLLDHVVHLDKSGRFADSRFFHRELQSLHQRRNFVNVFRKLFLWLSNRNLEKGGNQNQRGVKELEKAFPT